MRYYSAWLLILILSVASFTRGQQDGNSDDSGSDYESASDLIMDAGKRDPFEFIGFRSAVAVLTTSSGSPLSLAATPREKPKGPRSPPFEVQLGSYSFQSSILDENAKRDSWNLKSRSQKRAMKRGTFFKMQNKLPDPSSTPSNSATYLRLVTFNVGKFQDLYGFDSFRGIVEDVLAMEAHVISLQEVDTMRIGELRERLEEAGYRVFSCDYLASRSMVIAIEGERRDASGSATLNVTSWGVIKAIDRCFPFVRLDVVRPEESSSALKLSLVNVHLSHAFSMLRRKQLSLIYDRVVQANSPDEDSIIIGDFNIKNTEKLSEILESIQATTATNSKSSSPILDVSFPLLLDSDDNPPRSQSPAPLIRLERIDSDDSGGVNGSGSGSGGAGSRSSQFFTHWKGFSVDHVVTSERFGARLLDYGAARQVGSDHTMLYLDFNIQ